MLTIAVTPVLPNSPHGPLAKLRPIPTIDDGITNLQEGGRVIVIVLLACMVDYVLIIALRPTVDRLIKLVT